MRITSVTVGPERIEALLSFAEDEPLRTSDEPGLAVGALRALPGLRGHRCDNDAGLGFADELPDTEIAHLVEHATLELMALSGSPDTLRGETAWDFAADGARVFRLAIEYDNDVVALGALKSSARIVEQLVAGGEPDVAGEVARLRQLRG